MSDKELAVRNTYDFMVPTDYESALKISQSFAKSSLIPQHFRNHPTDVLVAISWGNQLGLSPVVALNGIAVINGRPSLWGQVFWAVVTSSPKFVKHEEGWDSEKEEWTTNIWVKGYDKPVVGRFSLEDAKKAGLLNDPNKKSTWGKYPKDMCMWKARSRAGKAGFSDALCGIAMAQEVIDIEVVNKPTPPSFDPETYSNAQTKPPETPEPTPPKTEPEAAPPAETSAAPPEEPKTDPVAAAKAEEKKKKAAEKKAAKEAETPKGPKESPSKRRDRVADFIQNNSSLYPDIKKLLTGVFPGCGNIDGAYLNHENLRDANAIPDKDIQTINDVLIGNGFYK